jgi:hypothetical protein
MEPGEGGHQDRSLTVLCSKGIIFTSVSFWEKESIKCTLAIKIKQGMIGITELERVFKFTFCTNRLITIL